MNMIVYNVSVKVEHDSADAWVRWMKEEHMPELMALGVFTDSRLCRLLDQDESDGLTYSAQYVCRNIDDYNAYLDKHADTMRERALKLFAGKFVAFRTVMEIL